MEPHEVEKLRRALAMVSDDQPAAITRSQALGLLAELQGLQVRRRDLEDGLRSMLADAVVSRHVNLLRPARAGLPPGKPNERLGRRRHGEHDPIGLSR